MATLSATGALLDVEHFLTAYGCRVANQEIRLSVVIDISKLSASARISDVREMYGGFVFELPMIIVA